MGSQQMREIQVFSNNEFCDSITVEYKLAELTVLFELVFSILNCKCSAQPIESFYSLICLC